MSYGLAAPTGLTQVAPMTFHALHALVSFSKAHRFPHRMPSFLPPRGLPVFLLSAKSRHVIGVMWIGPKAYNARPTRDFSVDSELDIHQRCKKEACVKHSKRAEFCRSIRETDRLCCSLTKSSRRNDVGDQQRSRNTQLDHDASFGDRVHKDTQDRLR